VPHLTLDGDPAAIDAAPVRWAAGVLRTAMGTHDDVPSVALRLGGADGDVPAGVADLPVPGDEESYAWVLERRDDEVIAHMSASDVRGYVYGISELADRIRHRGGAALTDGATDAGAPATPVRGIQRMFSSAHEDAPWFHDRSFWTEYLDHLASQRFNRFQLGFGMQYNFGTGTESRTATDNYLCFSYPFLLDVPGFSVRAQGVDAAERARNLEALRFVAQETRRRGMSFHLGLWNHAYDFAFDSPHWYPILGVSPDNHARYSAAALKQLLTEIPEIEGLVFRVHHEGGIPDEGHEQFWGEMFRAASEVGRPLEVDMHAKGVDDALRDAVRQPNLHATISAKYWAEHMGLPYHQASIRPLERKPIVWPGMDRTMTGVTDGARRFTRYGYADFLDEDRDIDVIFRMWPGTQKLLLWGDPVFAAGYGRNSTIGGARGVEFCEPLFFKGRRGTGEHGRRDPYVRDDLRLGVHDWRKYRYAYLLWGRLSYDPDASPEVWQRHLDAEYGAAADSIGRALAALSRILPLVTVVHGVSGANNFYWPEMYVDLAVSYWKQASHYAFDTPEPRTWEGVSPFDPELFASVGEYADAAVAAEPTAKYTPLEVAAWIDGLVAEGDAARLEAESLADRSDPQTERALIDLSVLAELGRFFAGKFAAAVDYAVYRRTGDTEAFDRAIAALTEAHAAYGRIPALVAGVYQDDLAFGVGVSERGGWRDRLGQMREDLYLLKTERAAAQAAASASPVTHRRSRRAVGHRFAVADRFERGAPIDVDLLLDDEPARVALHYRHLDQSEDYVRAEMTRHGEGWRGVVPGHFTDTTFPVMFYAVAEYDDDAPVLLPGLGAHLSDQPYLVVRSTAATPVSHG
jgi:hypothetical protein